MEFFWGDAWRAVGSGVQGKVEGVDRISKGLNVNKYCVQKLALHSCGMELTGQSIHSLYRIDLIKKEAKCDEVDITWGG